MSNLESVIEDSLSDAQLAPEPVESVGSTETSSEVPETAPVEAQDASEGTLFGGTEAEPQSTEVASPAVNQAQAAPPRELDEFEKKYGVQKESVPGRENRIPYSRVTKIVGKAVSEAKAEVENRVKTEYEPKIKQYETALQERDAQLTRVAQFEQVMVNDVPRFIGMLKTLPQYQQFFAQFEAQSAPTQAHQQVAQVNPEDEMPQPDQLMPDGSYMYSMEGLAKLQAWNRVQARKEVMSEVEKTYGPIHQEWEAHRRMRAVEPKVRDQIARARTWTLFNENEAEIVKVLQQYPDASLEDAYQFVVQPKLQEKLASYQTDEAKLRQQIRSEVLAELKRAPASTSAPARPSRPQPVTSSGPRKLEDIIAAQVETIR